MNDMNDTEQNDWREEFDNAWNSTALDEIDYDEEMGETFNWGKSQDKVRHFIESLLSSQARALKEQMKVEIVTILDKGWKPADNLVGIIQMELLSAMESIEI